MAHFYPISYTSVFKEKKVTFHFFFLENLRGNKILLIFFFFLKKQRMTAERERCIFFITWGENLLLSGTGWSVCPCARRQPCSIFCRM